MLLLVKKKIHIFKRCCSFPWLTTSTQSLALTGVAPAPADTGRSGHRSGLTQPLPSLPPSTVPGVRATPAVMAAFLPTPSTSSPSTLYQVISGLPLHFGAELPGFLKILQDKDIGRKVDHVLLSAAKGQPQEAAEVAHGGPHDVSWGEGKESWAGGRPCQGPRCLWGSFAEMGAHLWPNSGHSHLRMLVLPFETGLHPVQSAHLTYQLWWPPHTHLPVFLSLNSGVLSLPFHYTKCFLLSGFLNRYIQGYEFPSKYDFAAPTNNNASIQPFRILNHSKYFF